MAAPTMDSTSSVVEGRVRGGIGRQTVPFQREDSCKELTPGAQISGIVVTTEAPVPVRNPSEEQLCLAWLLFFLGFMFPPCWVAAMCIGCHETSNPSQKKAAQWSFLSILVFVMLSISIFVLATTSFN